MLVQMSERGPDSAGVAIYRDALAKDKIKLSLFSEASMDWQALGQELTQSTGSEPGTRQN